MSVEITARYAGHFHTTLTHGPSGSVLDTDAPKDNQGKGEAFSPTDLVGAALLACAVTTMALKGGLQTATGRVVKEMHPAPRRIASLVVEITLPASLSPDERAKLEDIARHCPVALSLSPEVSAPMRFVYA